MTDEELEDDGENEFEKRQRGYLDVGHGYGGILWLWTGSELEIEQSHGEEDHDDFWKSPDRFWHGRYDEVAHRVSAVAPDGWTNTPIPFTLQETLESVFGQSNIEQFNPPEEDVEDFAEVRKVEFGRDLKLKPGWKGSVFSDGQIATWRTNPNRDGAVPHHLDVYRELRAKKLIDAQYDAVDLTYGRSGTAFISLSEDPTKPGDILHVCDAKAYLQYFDGLRLDSPLVISTLDLDREFDDTVRKFHKYCAANLGKNPDETPLEFPDQRWIHQQHKPVQVTVISRDKVKEHRDAQPGMVDHMQTWRIREVLPDGLIVESYHNSVFARKHTAPFYITLSESKRFPKRITYV